MRIGHGFDAHRLVVGRKLMLGGVEIAYEKGLLGHSDADVLMHAVCDALLGAAALGDIGLHFPPSDERYKNASGIWLLTKTISIVRKEGYSVVNIDATVIAESPQLRPYIDEMRNNIASCCGVAARFINVKATTEEGMGYTGKGEGIAAHTVCLIEKRMIGL